MDFIYIHKTEQGNLKKQKDRKVTKLGICSLKQIWIFHSKEFKMNTTSKNKDLSSSRPALVTITVMKQNLSKNYFQQHSTTTNTLKLENEWSPISVDASLMGAREQALPNSNLKPSTARKSTASSNVCS
jgi:hypothetical protein